VSEKKNSPVIQVAFAAIQKQTAKLWLNSALSRRLCLAISMATMSVGMIMVIPSQRQLHAQQESLKINDMSVLVFPDGFKRVQFL